MIQKANHSSKASGHENSSEVFKPHLKEAWLCAYVYFNHFHEMDRFILNCLHSLVAMLRENELIKRYFFIRYSDDTGYHIRFRVFQPIQETREQLRSILSSAIAAYFVAEPLPSAKPVAGGHTPQSVHFEAYSPEYERYGGHQGMSTAERHFESSSEVAIKVLQLTKDNPSGRILLTLQLFFAMASAAGLEESRMNKFFDILFAPRIKSNLESVAVAQQLFSQNKPFFLEAIRNAHAALLSQPARNPTGLDLLDYHRRCHETFCNIRRLIAGNEQDDDFLSLHNNLLFPYFRLIKDLEENHRDYYKLLGFLVSCLHMTANRLGWTPEKEHILYGIMSLALTELYGPAYKLE